MFGTMLFLHLTGLILWFGALFAIVVLLGMARRRDVAQEARALVGKAVRLFGWLAHPSSIVVLVSGILMIIEMDFGDTAKPLWLTYMERGGGTIILAAIVLTALFGRKAVKRMTMPESSAAAAPRAGAALPAVTVFTVLILAILSVVLVVSLRL